MRSPASSGYPVLGTRVDRHSEDFRRNEAVNSDLAADLRRQLAETAVGGSEASRRRHVERGKLLPRERLNRLVDPGSPFLELSPLAARGMYGDECPGAGI